jgi:hypothetical protein
MFAGQTSQGLPNGGGTTHYQISYDVNLSAADGLTVAQQLFDCCEADFNWMAGLFQVKDSDFNYSFPIFVLINNVGGGSATWSSDGPKVQINAVGEGMTAVRWFMVSEVSEMFMSSKNNGWFYDGKSSRRNI